MSPPHSESPTPAVTHPGHDALNQQTGAEGQAAGAIEDEELLHLLQAGTEDALWGERGGVRAGASTGVRSLPGRVPSSSWYGNNHQRGVDSLLQTTMKENHPHIPARASARPHLQRRSEWQNGSRGPQAKEELSLGPWPEEANNLDFIISQFLKVSNQDP